MAWADPVVRGTLAAAWDYMRLVHAPAPSDAVLALGSFDPGVAVVAARFWHDGLAPVVVTPGGLAHRDGLLDTGWDRAEAHVFADIAAGRGVPRHAILVEDEAQNTNDNFAFGRRLLLERRVAAGALLVAARPKPRQARHEAPPGCGRPRHPARRRPERGQPPRQPHARPDA